jgi:hypothetical protein
MSFTPPPRESRMTAESAKARAEARRIAALGHEEVHRALGRDPGLTRGRRLWRRLLGMLTGTRYSD